MSKIQRFSNLQQEISFLSSTECAARFKERFLKSNLGKIHSAIPWYELVREMGLKDSRKGPKSYFSPKGKIALMFLKMYSGSSDSKLLEQLNSNVDYQMFCDIFISYEHLLKNHKIISSIRCELSSKINIDKLEKTLYKSWKPYIKEPEKILVDATCYESEVRYPSDVKLLWECANLLHYMIKKSCKSQDFRELSIRRPRNTYIKWTRKYNSYSKMRRKTKKKRVALTRGLLRLIEKYIGFVNKVNKKYDVNFEKNKYKRFSTIEKVYMQQYDLFHKGIKPKNRIVSLGKDYIRPIVRGKEIKSVEFGAKVNKLLIDGIGFIQHLDFDSFNEGTLLISTIYKAQYLTRVKVKVLGADAIYATNKNRSYITKEGIKTDFRPKGRQSKYHIENKTIRHLITKERASRLEGSFGKEKEHYHLKKVKAKTKANEILWIFFGIHTANALEIGRRKYKEKLKQIA